MTILNVNSSYVHYTCQYACECFCKWKWKITQLGVAKYQGKGLTTEEESHSICSF